MARRIKRFFVFLFFSLFFSMNSGKETQALPTTGKGKILNTQPSDALFAQSCHPPGGGEIPGGGSGYIV
ncbi:MAG: hypothetical protein IKS41_00705 [Alphaproteobacteria bacterium]|nr:hypothetical protein [Alphaproteobacteria bacterium]